MFIDKKLIRSFRKTIKELIMMTPILLGTLLLIGLSHALVPNSFYIRVFSRNGFLGSLIGAAIGSISAGNPVTSYILSGEAMKQGVGLLAVTAFIVSWVTVGLIQLPAEMMILGKKFAIIRNLSAFILSIIVAFLTVLIFNLL